MSAATDPRTALEVLLTPTDRCHLHDRLRGDIDPALPPLGPDADLPCRVALLVDVTAESAHGPPPREDTAERTVQSGQAA